VLRARLPAARQAGDDAALRERVESPASLRVSLLIVGAPVFNWIYAKADDEAMLHYPDTDEVDSITRDDWDKAWLAGKARFANSEGSAA
jgi:hypothetical protein